MLCLAFFKIHDSLNNHFDIMEAHICFHFVKIGPLAELIWSTCPSHLWLRFSEQNLMDNVRNHPFSPVLQVPLASLCITCTDKTFSALLI